MPFSNVALAKMSSAVSPMRGLCWTIAIDTSIISDSLFICGYGYGKGTGEGKDKGNGKRGRARVRGSGLGLKSYELGLGLG